MADTPDITQMTLEKIQDDIAALCDRLGAFETRLARRWEDSAARWEQLADEQRSWRKRFDHEQVVRERQARKSLELFDLLIRKVQQLEERVSATKPRS